LYAPWSEYGEKTTAKRDKWEGNENSKGFCHLLVFEAIVNEQLSTADDTLEDWRDIIPEDVEEFERRIELRKNMKGVE